MEIRRIKLVGKDCINILINVEPCVHLGVMVSTSSTMRHTEALQMKYPFGIMYCLNKIKASLNIVTASFYLRICYLGCYGQLSFMASLLSFISTLLLTSSYFVRHIPLKRAFGHRNRKVVRVKPWYLFENTIAVTLTTFPFSVML